MRIRGYETPSYPRKRVYLPRGDAPPIPFEIEALPLDQDGAIYALFPLPRAPEEYVRDSRNVILRDPKTDKCLSRIVEDDPDYQRDAAKQVSRRHAFIVRRGLRADANVEFDSDSIEPKSLDDARGWDAWADAVLHELAAAKLTMGEVITLSNDVLSLGTPSIESLREARDRFLPREEGRTSPTLLLTEPAASFGT